MWSLICGSQENKDLLNLGQYPYQYYQDSALPATPLSRGAKSASSLQFGQGDTSTGDGDSTIHDGGRQWRQATAFIATLRQHKKRLDDEKGEDEDDEEEEDGDDDYHHFNASSDPKTSWLYIFISTSTFILLGAIVAAYLAMGALYFKPTEAAEESLTLKNLKLTREGLFQTMKASYKVSPNESLWKEKASKTLSEFEDQLGTIFRKRIGAGGQDIANESDITWTIYGSTVFCASIITSIGWGNVVPKTERGRLSCVVYAIFGIPLLFSFASSLSTLINILAQKMWNLLSYGSQAIKSKLTSKQSGKKDHSEANKTLNRIPSGDSLIFPKHFQGKENIISETEWIPRYKYFNSRTFDKGDGLWEESCRCKRDSKYHSSLTSTIDYIINAVEDPTVDTLTRPHYRITRKDVTLLSRYLSKLDFDELEKCMRYAGVDVPSEILDLVWNMENKPLSTSAHTVVSRSDCASLSSSQNVDNGAQYEPPASENFSSKAYSVCDHFRNSSAQLQESSCGRSSSLASSLPFDGSPNSHDIAHEKLRQRTDENRFVGNEYPPMKDNQFNKRVYSSEIALDTSAPKSQLCSTLHFDSYHVDTSSGEPLKRQHENSKFVGVRNKDMNDGYFIKSSFRNASDVRTTYEGFHTTPTTSTVNSYQIDTIDRTKEKDFTSTLHDPVSSKYRNYTRHNVKKVSSFNRSHQTQSLMLNRCNFSNMAQYSTVSNKAIKSSNTAFRTKSPFIRSYQINHRDKNIPTGTKEATSPSEMHPTKSSSLHKNQSALYIKNPTVIVKETTAPDETHRPKSSKLYRSQKNTKVKHTITFATETTTDDKSHEVKSPHLPRSQMDGEVKNHTGLADKNRGPKITDLITSPTFCRSRHDLGVKYPSGFTKAVAKTNEPLYQAKPFSFYRHQFDPEVNSRKGTTTSFRSDLVNSPVIYRSQHDPAVVTKKVKAQNKGYLITAPDQYSSRIDPDVNHPKAILNDETVHSNMSFPCRQLRKNNEFRSHLSKTREGKESRSRLENEKLQANASFNHLKERKASMYTSTKKWNQCRTDYSSLRRLNIDSHLQTPTSLPIKRKPNISTIKGYKMSYERPKYPTNTSSNRNSLDILDTRYKLRIASKIDVESIGFINKNANQNSNDANKESKQDESSDSFFSDYSEGIQKEDAERTVPFVIYILLVGVLVVIGMFLFKSLSEKSSLTNGLYFTVVLLTTIGFGDIIPTQEYYMTLVLFGFLGLALANFVTNRIIENILDTIDFINRHVELDDDDDMEE